MTPTLVFASSTDGDKDPVRYIVEIDKVATFDGVDKITVNVNDSGAAEIMLALQTELTEDTTYYWRVRADDGEAKSNFSETAEFVVNATNEVPGAPTPLTPSNDSVQSGPLTLTVQNAADPDGDGLTYEFVLALDSGLTQRVAQIGGVAQGTTTTALSLNQLVLSPDTTYYWAARVTDTHGATSDWSSVFSFSTPLSAADVESGDIDSGELPDVEADTTSTDGTPDDDAGDDIAPTPDTTSNDSVTPQNDTGGPQIDGSATVDASENQNSGGGGSCQTAPLANVDPFALLLLLSAFIAVLARQRPASHRRSALHLR
ncbi:MAG: hypothetical protein KC609_20340 [Myxococcales bacterium]|nr:hypothetical protein [Myxococcales bacterium]